QNDDQVVLSTKFTRPWDQQQAPTNTPDGDTQQVGASHNGGTPAPAAFNTQSSNIVAPPTITVAQVNSNTFNVTNSQRHLGNNPLTLQVEISHIDGFSSEQIQSALIEQADIIPLGGQGTLQIENRSIQYSITGVNNNPNWDFRST
ncbi:MAG TPA: hypothetical protein V6C96_03325, partial [Vampirovibrionales bacterium]